MNIDDAEPGRLFSWYDDAVLRRPFTFALALSLLICLATLVLWARSQFRMDWANCFWVKAPGDHRLLQIGSITGKLMIEFKCGVDNRLWPESSLSLHSARPQSFEDEIPDLENPRHAMGIWYAHEGGGGFHHYLLFIPHPLLALATVLLPVSWLKRCRRAGQYSRSGRCTHCGYDLRASPERCPECGQRGRIEFVNT